MKEKIEDLLQSKIQLYADIETIAMNIQLNHIPYTIVEKCTNDDLEVLNQLSNCID